MEIDPALCTAVTLFAAIPRQNARYRLIRL